MSRISGSSRASKLMGRAGDGSTLSLDFTAMGGVLDPLITFSRADADARATFINSSGFVETVATAQAPRFTFSETSIGTPRGLLIEAPATNVALQSEEFTTSPFFWGYNATTRTVESSDVNPRGTTGSISVAPTSNGSSRYMGAFATGLTTASFYTFSIWLKAKGTAQAEFIAFNSLGTISSSITILSQPSGGSATVSNSPGIVPRISGLSSSGWTRIAVTTSAALGGTGAGNFFLYPSNTSASTTADSIYVYGAQLEASSLASSYIKTTTAPVTRAVDTAIIAAGTNFSSWYTGGTTGTFVTEWCRCSPTTTQRTVIATSDVSNQHLHQYIAATTSRLRLADKVPAFIETANASVDNSINKGAFSYSGSVQSLCLNGGTVVPGTLTFTTAPTWLSIGGPSTNGTSITDTAVVLNNAIRKIKYFPTRLSDGQIQGLTA
jgi:hypothetical protein